MDSEEKLDWRRVTCSFWQSWGAGVASCANVSSPSFKVWKLGNCMEFSVNAEWTLHWQNHQNRLTDRTSDVIYLKFVQSLAHLISVQRASTLKFSDKGVTFPDLLFLQEKSKEANELGWNKNMCLPSSVNFLQKSFQYSNWATNCLHVPSLKANHKCYHELSRPSALKPELPRWGWGRGPPEAMAGICQAFSPGLCWLRNIINIFSFCQTNCMALKI